MFGVTVPFAAASGGGVARFREPAHDPGMDTWEQLRADLLRLQTAQPTVLYHYPNPGGDRNDGPYSVSLVAFAEDVAAELHAKYGDAVQLTLGALPYPLDQQHSRSESGRDPTVRPPSLDLDTRLTDPLVMRSGHAASHNLLITNHADVRAVLHTHGALDSVIVALQTGRLVGGSTLPSHAALVRFAVPPHETVTVPVFVGTESFESSLGFRVPAGRWGLVALLDVRLDYQDIGSPPTETRSSVLPISITD